MKNQVEISIELKDLIPIFLEETKKNIELLKESILNNDLEKIKFYSHRIKGSSGSYGFVQLSLISKQIEDIVKSNYDNQKISNLFKSLEDYFNNLEIIYVNKPL